MNQKISRFEGFGMLIGTGIGGAIPWLFWFFSARLNPAQWLFWGAPLQSFACVTGFIGAAVGICFGHAIRNSKSRPRF